MNTSRLLICCLIVLVVGCKDKEVPEHILQQRAYEQRQRELKQKEEQEAKQAKAKTLRTGPSMWTGDVRKAVVKIYQARGLQATRAIQALVHLGPTSAAALRHIAGSVAMDQRKQVMASLVLVELQMFQPAQLAELGRAHELPFIQQAAVEALGRLGNPQAERLLNELAPQLTAQGKQLPPSHAGHAHAGTNRPLRPMAQVLQKAKDRSRKWWYSDKQLTALDRLLQADTPNKLQIALSAVTDRTLDKGLRAILAAAAARPPVKAAVAHRIVELDKDKLQVLRRYCGRREPQLLRLAAARRLLELGQRAFVEKLSKQMGDPLMPVLERLLKAPPSPPGAPAVQP